MSLLVLLLLGCPGGSDAPAEPQVQEPAPAVVPGQAVHPPPPTVRIPPDATEVPAPYRCPDGQRGGLGCFRHVPGNTFLMGAQATDPEAPGHDPEARPEEGPVHQVTVSPFWLQSWLVSAGEYDRCVASGWCPADQALTGSAMATVGAEGRGEHPAVGVTWDGAQRYCAWWGGRLPTEAEWELAARSTTGRRWPWGNDPRCPQRIAGAEEREGGSDLDGVVDTCGPVIAALSEALDEPTYNALTRPLGELLSADELMALCLDLRGRPAAEVVAAIQAKVGEARQAGSGDLVCAYDGPTPMGEARGGTPEMIFGLAGNVWEWTVDGYGPYDASPATDPVGADTGHGRAQRGGSWMSTSPVDWRTTVRAGMAADARLPDVGFRCAFAGARP